MNGSWRSRVSEALLLLLGVAIVARAVFSVMAPLLPGLVVLVLLAWILALLIRRR